MERGFIQGQGSIFHTVLVAEVIKSSLSVCMSVGLSKLLTPCADKSVLKGFGMGGRCSFFHMALIELILRNTFVGLFYSTQ